MNATPLILLGGGGHGRVVAELARAAGWTVAGFVDPGLKAGEMVSGVPVLGSDPLPWLETHAAVVTIGDNVIRLREHLRLVAAGATIPALVHPAATVSPSALIGAGTVIMAGAVVQAGAKIGEAVVLNTRAGVDHDCEIGDGALIAPGATLCGGVHVGAGALVGAGAVVVPGVRIGAGALLGAGAAAIRDLGDGLRLKPWKLQDGQAL